MSFPSPTTRILVADGGGRLSNSIPCPLSAIEDPNDPHQLDTRQDFLGLTAGNNRTIKPVTKPKQSPRTIIFRNTSSPTTNTVGSSTLNHPMTRRVAMTLVQPRIVFGLGMSFDRSNPRRAKMANVRSRINIPSKSNTLLSISSSLCRLSRASLEQFLRLTVSPTCHAFDTRTSSHDPIPQRHLPVDLFPILLQLGSL